MVNIHHSELWHKWRKMSSRVFSLFFLIYLIYLFYHYYYFCQVEFSEIEWERACKHECGGSHCRAHKRIWWLKKGVWSVFQRVLMYIKSISQLQYFIRRLSKDLNLVWFYFSETGCSFDYDSKTGLHEASYGQKEATLLSFIRFTKEHFFLLHSSQVYRLFFCNLRSSWMPLWIFICFLSFTRKNLCKKEASCTPLPREE